MSLAQIIIFSAQSRGGNTPVTLSPPSSITGTAGDGKVLIEFPLAANATNYRVQIASDSGFTTDVVSKTVQSGEAIIVAVNDTDYYYRVQSLRVGSTPSAWKESAGTITPAYDTKLAQPAINSVVAVDGGIFLSWSDVADQDSTLVELSTDFMFFDSIAKSVEVTGTSTTIAATNGTAYSVRITAQSKLKRSSPEAYYQHNRDGYYNTFTPHVIDGAKLHTPHISDVILGDGSVQLIVSSNDLRDVNYTVEASEDIAFASVSDSTTAGIDDLILSSLSNGTVYRLRLRSEAPGLTPSDWFVYDTYVSPAAANIGIPRFLTTGDSNTAAVPYGIPWQTQILPYLNTAIWGLSPNISNQGIGSSIAADQFVNESGTLNWGGYDNSITVNGYSAAYETNDFTLGAKTAAQFVATIESLYSIRNSQGFKCVTFSPGIPYGGSYGGIIDLPGLYRKANNYFKNNGKTILKSYGHVSQYDTDELHIYTDQFASYWQDPHYHDNGYLLTAMLALPIIEIPVGRIFSKPATPISFTFNPSTHLATVILPDGFVPSDAEITLNWDGGAGFESTWVRLSAFTHSITTTQAAGTVAVRIAATHQATPSDNLTNSSQWN